MYKKVVYWLVFFSVIVHGISVPILHLIYKWCKVPVIRDEPIEVVLLSHSEPLPANSTAQPQRHTAILNNRFSRQDDSYDEPCETTAEVAEAGTTTATTAQNNVRRAMTVHNPIQHDPPHNSHLSQPHPNFRPNIFRRAMTSYDHSHRLHNLNNLRHDCESLHGSDEIRILQDTEEGRIHPRSLSESTESSIDRRHPTSQEVPRDMF